jgi:hypothetical protein
MSCRLRRKKKARRDHHLQTSGDPLAGECNGAFTRNQSGSVG